MTPGHYKRHLLFLADGDLHKALDICIHQLAVAGHCISAGYVRDPQTYSSVDLSQQDALDIDSQDSPHG